MADVVEARPERPLGPGDQGRLLELEEFEAAEFEPGFHYELVDGRLDVSPEPDFPHDEPLAALHPLLQEYRRQHPQAFDYLSLHGRIFPGGRHSVGPDLALFRGHRPFSGQRWEDLEPVLVVEVLSPGQEDKDLVRNKRLYGEVESIREYWVIDSRRGWARLSLRVLQRDESNQWSEQLLLQGARYQSPLFPGLVVDLSRPDLGLVALEAIRLARAREQGRIEVVEEQLRELLVGFPQLDTVLQRLQHATPEAVRVVCSLVLRVRDPAELVRELDRVLPSA